MIATKLSDLVGLPTLKSERSFSESFIVIFYQINIQRGDCIIKYFFKTLIFYKYKMKYIQAYIKLLSATLLEF